MSMINQVMLTVKSTVSRRGKIRANIAMMVYEIQSYALVVNTSLRPLEVLFVVMTSGAFRCAYWTSNMCD